MGLLDKVKETAQKGADFAKEGVKAGQDKIDDQKLKKKVGDLKEELGGVVYAQKSGSTAEGVDPEAEVTRIVAELNGGRSRARRRRVRRRRRRRQRGDGRQLERRQGRRRGDQVAAEVGIAVDRVVQVGRIDAVTHEQAPLEHVGGDGHVGRRRRCARTHRERPVAATVAGEHEPGGPGIVLASGHGQGERQDPTREVGHQRDVARLAVV